MQGNFPEELSVFNVLLFETICISPWAVSTPFIIRAARRFSFEDNQRYKSFFVHLSVALVVFCFHMVIQSLAVSWFYNEPLTWSYLWLDFRGFIDMRLMLYTGLLLGIYVIDLQRKNREVELREPRLKAQLNNAKYRALLNQIQPDFLIDSLTSIEDNLPDDPQTAEHILIDLSDLLRIMLRNIDQEDVSIQKDLEAFHLYVDILQKRFKTDIQKNTNIDRDCYDARIPSYLILIPFIEKVVEKASRDNSINSISYEAKRQGNEVHLKSTIDGIPQTDATILDTAHQEQLTNISKRLKDKFAPSVKLAAQRKGSQLSIQLHLPYLHVMPPSKLQSAGAGNAFQQNRTVE